MYALQTCMTMPLKPILSYNDRMSYNAGIEEPPAAGILSYVRIPRHTQFGGAPIMIRRKHRINFRLDDKWARRCRALMQVFRAFGWTELMMAAINFTWEHNGKPELDGTDAEPFPNLDLWSKPSSSTRSTATARPATIPPAAPTKKASPGKREIQELSPGMRAVLDLQKKKNRITRKPAKKNPRGT